MLSETKFAVNVAEKAGKILMAGFGNIKTIKEKSPKNFVTDIDIASEKIILGAIKKHFPKHIILSEEEGIIGKNSDYIWHVDPLDGTHNFIHRFPFFGVSIGLEYKKEVIMGVIYIPTLRQIFTAEKGKGAYLNKKKVHVSKDKKLHESMVSMDVVLHYNKKKALKALNRLSNDIFIVRSPGAAVFELSCVAQGITAAHISFSTHSWDVAAGFLLIREAGGKITDLKGNEADHYCSEFVASNGMVHNQILKCLNRK